MTQWLACNPAVCADVPQIKKDINPTSWNCTGCPFHMPQSSENAPVVHSPQKMLTRCPDRHLGKIKITSPYRKEPSERQECVQRWTEQSDAALSGPSSSLRSKETSAQFCCCCYWFSLEGEREREGERHINLFFYSFMHSSVSFLYMP